MEEKKEWRKGQHFRDENADKVKMFERKRKPFVFPPLAASYNPYWEKEKEKREKEKKG